MIINVPQSFSSAITNTVQFDGSSYSLVIYYQIFGQRFYFKIYNGNNVLIVNCPLVDGGINNVKGYFTTTTMVYSSTDNLVTILP